VRLLLDLCGGLWNTRAGCSTSCRITPMMSCLDGAVTTTATPTGNWRAVSAEVAMEAGRATTATGSATRARTAALTAAGSAAQEGSRSAEDDGDHTGPSASGQSSEYYDASSDVSGEEGAQSRSTAPAAATLRTSGAGSPATHKLFEDAFSICQGAPPRGAAPTTTPLSASITRSLSGFQMYQATVMLLALVPVLATRWTAEDRRHATEFICSEIGECDRK